jgi:hypothetical protein
LPFTSRTRLQSGPTNISFGGCVEPLIFVEIKMADDVTLVTSISS